MKIHVCFVKMIMDIAKNALKMGVSNTSILLAPFYRNANQILLTKKFLVHNIQTLRALILLDLKKLRAYNNYKVISIKVSLI
jgi:hypothetical protein